MRHSQGSLHGCGHHGFTPTRPGTGGELRDTLVFFFPALGARPEVARVAVQELLGDFNFLTCMGVSENVVE